MDLTSTVAANLRRLRNAKGITQEELAERAGINRNYVGMIERETNSPTIKVLEKLARALGADPQAFFVEPGRTPPSED
jgi:transcriptional regulator with XRE-family HTH domain